jgi:hypothetical protein
MLKLGAPAPLAFVFTSPAIDTQNPISDPYLRHRALTTQHRQQNRQKLTLQLYDKSMCAYNPEFAPFPAAGRDGHNQRIDLIALSIQCTDS